MHDPIGSLRDAGFPVDQLTHSQRDVLAALSEQETAVVASVHARLRDAEDEVSGHELKML